MKKEQKSNLLEDLGHNGPASVCIRGVIEKYLNILWKKVYVGSMKEARGWQRT